MKKMNGLLMIVALLTGLISCNKEEPETPQQTTDTILYTMPSEEEQHEGTWLQWPHNNTYSDHIVRMEGTFIEMARALHTGERVHIVVYDETERNRVTTLLTNEGLNMSQVDFFVAQTDDMWVRDNGPIFARDKSGNLIIQDWGFNGWGNKAPYSKCDPIPTKIANELGISAVDVPMINEGGSVEIDGNGTLMAKRSSILNSNRNPGMTEAEAESIFNRYLGITNFIWLEGLAGVDITDDHIDGYARFANEHTIVATQEANSDPEEFQIVANAKNAQGVQYNVVYLPGTQNNMPGTNYKGIYINFYVGNEVVLVPNFNDPKDAEANTIIQGIYPNRTVVGIPAVELGIDGGGIHCVTQQQPM